MSTKPGTYHDAATDPHLWKSTQEPGQPRQFELDPATGEKIPIPQDFDHSFDEGFIDPDAFGDIAAANRVAHDRCAQVLAGFPPGPKRPEMIERSSAADLVYALKHMGVLTPEDFSMLGMNKNGTLPPGAVLLTQDVYAHLRWREHEFLQGK